MKQRYDHVEKSILSAIFPNIIYILMVFKFLTIAFLLKPHLFAFAGFRKPLSFDKNATHY